ATRGAAAMAPPLHVFSHGRILSHGNPEFGRQEHQKNQTPFWKPAPEGRFHWWAERDSNPRPLRCEGIPGPFAPCPPTSANRFTTGFLAPGSFPQRPPGCAIFRAIGST